MSIRERACRASIRPTAGTRSPAREAARRNRARSAIISANSSAWALRSSSACRPRTRAYQKEAAARLHLPFAVLSDEKLALTRALNLPTFSTAGMTLLKRMALVIDDGVISKVFYPVFPPDKNAAEVIAWLQRSR